MLLYCGMLLLTFMLLYQKRGSAAVLKLCNRSHKSKKKQGRIVLCRRLIVSSLHSEFRGFLIRGFSVAISLKLRIKSRRGRKGFLLKRDRVFLFSVIRYYNKYIYCLLYTSPSPRDLSTSRMPSSA